MAVSILFFARNGTRDNFFELFAKVFRSFRPRGNFFDGPKNFQILADSAAIRLVQKSSKSEPSSRFFSHLKFRKSLPVYVLPKFPRRIQNRNGHVVFVVAVIVRSINRSVGQLIVDVPCSHHVDINARWPSCFLSTTSLSFAGFR